MKENKAYIGIGSNLGNRDQNIATALKEIKEFSTIKKQSKAHETASTGDSSQPDYLNMAIEIETPLTPIELIFRLHEIEHKMGRVRDPENQNAARTIDLDILLYKQEIISEKSLKIPHPRMHKRKFVLQPLAEIAAQTIHPKLKKTIATLLQEL